MTFHYTTRRGDRGYHYADVLDLPGCSAMGSTPAELRDNVRLAVRWHLRAGQRRPAAGSGGREPQERGSAAEDEPFELVEVTIDGRPVPTGAASTTGDPGSAAGPVRSGPPVLAYAAPDSVRAALPASVPAVRPDDGPFYRLGRRFNPGTREWVGRAIASPRSIYLLKVELNTHDTPVGYIQVGLADPDDLRTCRVADLPDAVRAALDPRGEHAARDVIVVPRESVSRVSVARVDNYLRLRVGGHRMTVYTLLFRGIGIARFLTANGWTINQDVVAMEEPTFGHGYGRSEPPPPEDVRTVAKRWGYLVFGLLMMIALIAKAWMRTKR